MPNVGEDDDFSRNRGYMGERAYLKALTMDGSPGDKILGAMIDQLNKSSASAEAAIDWALLEIDASNRRIQAVRRDENFKAT